MEVDPGNRSTQRAPMRMLGVQIELGRQPLNRASTPAGQHGVQTPSRCLHGHKLPRVAIGAVNHPPCALCYHRLTLSVYGFMPLHGM
jgi:hypothetical protein